LLLIIIGDDKSVVVVVVGGGDNHGRSNLESTCNVTTNACVMANADHIYSIDKIVGYIPYCCCIKSRNVPVCYLLLYCIIIPWVGCCCCVSIKPSRVSRIFCQATSLESNQKNIVEPVMRAQD
jgi:hypothetical protein